MVDNTVFRFVTVRGPNQPSAEEDSTSFFRYDNSLDSPVLDAYLTKDLNEARSIAGDYTKTSDFATSLQHFEEKQSGLALLGEQITAEAHRVTRDKIKEIVSASGLSPDNETLKWLWSNLATHALVGGRPEIRDIIIKSMRAYKILLAGNLDEWSESALKRMASATVLMPSRAEAPRTQNRDDQAEEVPENQPEPARKRGAKAAEKFTIIRRAADELAFQLQREIDRARGEPQPLRTPEMRGGCMEPIEGSGGQEAPSALQYEALLLSSEKIRALSNETKAVLLEAGVEPGMRINLALDRLQSFAQDIELELMPGIVPSSTVIATGGGMFWLDAEAEPHGHLEPILPIREDRYYGDFFAGDRDCAIYPLGIADYRRVEQRLYCYEPGEVAHIENVMKGESKERNTRNLRRSEEVNFLATQEETTTEKDTQTTDRFEITREADKVVQEDIKFDLGVNVQAEYGPVKITADTKFAYAKSTTESDRQASTYARDVTERALERVIKLVREERTSRVVNEFEETNKHVLKGEDDSHTVGLYRWVDKIYEHRVVNYGKRLVFEFLVPEPAAFHLYASAKSPVENGLVLQKPVDPRSTNLKAVTGLDPITSYKSLTEFNYHVYAAAYEAKVEPPPRLLYTTAKAYHREGMDHTVQFADSKNDFKLPEGYEAASFVCGFGIHSETHSGGPNWITISIGNQSRFSVSGSSFSTALPGEDDIVPVTVMGRTRYYATNIEVLCRRTDRAYDEWRTKAFDAVIGAYNNKLAAYNNELAAARSRLGVEIRGSNPAGNRHREQTELKKGCVRMLAQRCDPLWSNAMKDDQECGIPEFDCCEAVRDGSYVQFVEQCFDWRLMTYMFYPYFWGRKCNWKTIYQIDDADPTFLGFLQAGYARVSVPVSPGYEGSALKFLADGSLWGGDGIPGVDDPLYRSIVVEMMEEVGKVDDTIKPWKTKVPTTLTVLQCESGCVPGNGLPCPGKNKDWPPPGQ